MLTASVNYIAAIAGLSIQSTKTLNGTAHEGGQFPSATPAACTYGGLNVYDSLHTFAFDDTPDLEAGDVLAVFWAGGRRAELIVNDVDGLAVTVHNDDTGQGDALPASGTVLTACKRARNDLRFAAAQLVALAAAGEDTGDALLVFRDDSDSVLMDLPAGGYAGWDNEQTTASPLADLSGVLTLDVYAAAALTVTVGLLQDSAL
ncbi:MAG: hypothetical protein GX547_16230 [Phycisphaerae bacterium]|nr:hypothetical protein [Phycisphaerae bacterium]